MKYVDGYEGLYSISDDGTEIYSHCKKRFLKVHVNIYGTKTVKLLGKLKRVEELHPSTLGLEGNAHDKRDI